MWRYTVNVCSLQYHGEEEHIDDGVGEGLSHLRRNPLDILDPLIVRADSLDEEQFVLLAEAHFALVGESGIHQPMKMPRMMLRMEIIRIMYCQPLRGLSTTW
jgi:hypothetical protein